jgi:glycosyltransferase involved in cell wall biosynthesis
MTRLGQVSVCMATYQGSSFVRAQLDSILAQLDQDDEVIVVDDASTDGTPGMVRDIGDPRVRVVVRERNVGYAAGFETALALATGDHLLLSDQDDVWPAGRVLVMQEALRDGQVVAGNVSALTPGVDVRPVGVVGSWRLTPRLAHRRRWMTLRLALSQAPYYGSAMAVRRDLLAVALPFPSAARELHDAWLALLGLRAGTLRHVDEVVVLRRVHDSNASGRPRSVLRVLRGRAYFAIMWWTARRRMRRLGP